MNPINIFNRSKEMSQEEKTMPIRKYERLRKLAHELEVQTTTVKQRLVELEFLLTDRSIYLNNVLSRDKE